MYPVTFPYHPPLGQLALLFLFAWPGQTWGQISFRENYADKVVSVREFGETYYEQLQTGKFTARFRFPVSQPVPLSGETRFVIVLGDWTYDGFFSDDPQYAEGSTKVQIPLEGGKLSLAFTGSVVTGAVNSKTGYNVRFDYYETSPVAASFVGETRMITPPESIAFSFTSDGVSWMAAGNSFLTGSAKTKTVVRGPRDFADEFDLTRVKIKAEGSVAADPLIETSGHGRDAPDVQTAAE